MRAAGALAMTGSVGNSAWQRACAAVLILLLGLLAITAGREGLSDFFAQSADLEIERWSQPGQHFREGDWQRVMRYLGRSLYYAPDNPWALEDLGALQLRSMRAATDPRLAVAAARSAKRDFRLALIDRPTSPFTWSNLALSKLYLGERDGELSRALGRAEKFGPWEPKVQQSVVFVGLAVWNWLNPSQRAAVVRMMRRGAERDPGKIAEIAKSFNRVDLFCALGYIGSQLRELCNPAGESARRPNR